MPEFFRTHAGLAERDYEILSHVMRYRITTPEVLHENFEFSYSERNAVTKVTSRLCERGFLLKFKLYQSYSYFTITCEGARRVGKSISRKRVGQLKPNPLYRAYGMLAFCCVFKTRRMRLGVGELEKKYPECMAAKGDKSHFYVEQRNEIEHLGYAWVEGGGTVDHIFNVVSRNILERHRLDPRMKQRIDEGRFEISIVTYNSEKRDDIATRFEKLRHPVPVRVEFVPELVHLLPSA